MNEFDRDIEHLKLLSIFHYVAAGLSAVFGLMSSLYIIMGLVFINADFQGNNPPPPFMGWMFIIIGAGTMVILLTVAMLFVKAGNSLRTQRNYTTCMVTAALACLWVPVGTVLGVFTIIVLNRPTVRQLFGKV